MGLTQHTFQVKIILRQTKTKFQDTTEYQLNPEISPIAIFDIFDTPEIDLFASPINRQTEKYASWKPEP